MIRKSGYRFSLATNAKRLRGDHAQTKGWSGMTIRRKVIPLQHDPEKWVPVFRKDHAQTKRWSGMTIRRKVIPLQHDPEKWVPVFREDHAQTNDGAGRR